MIGVVSILAFTVEISAVTKHDKPINNDKLSEDGWTSHCSDWGRPDAYTKVIEVEGHKYIILTGLHMGSIVHAASCPCNLTSAK